MGAGKANDKIHRLFVENSGQAGHRGDLLTLTKNIVYERRSRWHTVARCQMFPPAPRNKGEPLTIPSSVGWEAPTVAVAQEGKRLPAYGGREEIVFFLS